MDVKHGFVLPYVATVASVHDSHVFRQLMDYNSKVEMTQEEEQAPHRGESGISNAVYPQVLNPATKLYIFRRGTTRWSQWTKCHSCRITICIYRNLSTNLLPYICGAFNSCNIKYNDENCVNLNRNPMQIFTHHFIEL